MSIEVLYEKKLEICCLSCGSKLQYTSEDIVEKCDYVKTGWLTGFYHYHNEIVCPVCKFETWVPKKNQRKKDFIMIDDEIMDALGSLYENCAGEDFARGVRSAASMATSMSSRASADL